MLYLSSSTFAFPPWRWTRYGDDGLVTTPDDPLWNTAVGPGAYDAGGGHYQAAVLEQYKLYVEMADRVSARRSTANAFFLSLNTSMVAALAVLIGSGLSDPPCWTLALGLAAAHAQCATWWATVRSYRQLNVAKYRVIALLEERLPARAFSGAEWAELGEGRDWRRYLPLSMVEGGVPMLFAVAYTAGFATAAWS